MADTCPPGTVATPVQRPDGVTVIACIGHVEVTCEAPKVKVCVPKSPPEPVCTCEMPSPPLIHSPANTVTAPQVCEVRFQYQPDRPSTPTEIAPLPPGCDAAGLEIAAVAILARLFRVTP